MIRDVVSQVCLSFSACLMVYVLGTFNRGLKEVLFRLMVSSRLMDACFKELVSSPCHLNHCEEGVSHFGL